MRAVASSSLLVLLALLLPLVPDARPARAADAPAAGAPSVVAWKTDRVVVFKDGYAMWTKSGTAVADPDGFVHSDEVPDEAVLGCVWAEADGRRVLGLHAGVVETTEARERREPCLDVRELLRVNVGRAVVLESARDGGADVAGTVVGVLEAPAPAEPSTARTTPTGARAPAPAYGVSAPPPAPTATVTRPSLVGGTLVALDVAGARVVLPVAEVRSVRGAGLETTILRQETVTTRRKRLSIDLGREAAGSTCALRLHYFAAGLRWIPTYRVGGDLEGEADVTLQGEVVNDAEDVVGAALDLVVGVPTFRFKDVASPLTLEQLVRAAVAADPRRGRRSDVVFQGQMLGSNAFRNEGDPSAAATTRGGAISAAPELATEGLQDLFLYGLPRVTVRRGDRASLTLWDAKAPVRHVWTADVVVVRNHRAGDAVYRSAREETELAGSRDASSALGPSRRPVVWHELELANRTRVPWTTGAALVARGGLPVGQDLLGYTSPGATTRLPMTVAVDVQGRWSEVEVSREQRIVYGGRDLVVVAKRGTFTVVNRRAERTPVRVALSLGGRVEAASDGGTITVNDGTVTDWVEWPWSWWGYVANHSDVVWALDLAPGETKAVTVEFTFPLPL
ncbi:MAG: hypothetical protein IT460_14025 [Planctomycetes bacterium]|nr:hypothetical protein [Planctomycetota bacterium]